MRYDQDLMIGVTKEADKILLTLEKIFQKTKRSVCLEAGDLLIMKNHKVIHGRSVFTPNFDKSYRWLQRVKVKTNISDTYSDYDKESKVITTTFN